MKFRLTTNFDRQWEQFSDKVKAKLPLATAIAMTRTVQEIPEAVVAEMQAVFDRPTPWTLGSVRYSKATAQNLSASVWLDDAGRGGSSHPIAEHLIAQIEGGVRVEKRSEAILRAAGILPPGHVAVPGAGADLDAYGNMSRGQIQQILSALRLAETVRGFLANRTKRSAARNRNQPQIFAATADSPRTRHLKPGIYQRVADGLLPLLMFVRTAQYRAVLDFVGVCQRKADEVFGDHLREQIAVTVARNG